MGDLINPFKIVELQDGLMYIYNYLDGNLGDLNITMDCANGEVSLIAYNRYSVPIGRFDLDKRGATTLYLVGSEPTEVVAEVFNIIEVTERMIGQIIAYKTLAA